jgi:hypothetical protein
MMLDCFPAERLGCFPAERLGSYPATTTSARPGQTRQDQDRLVPTGAAKSYVELDPKVCVQLHSNSYSAVGSNLLFRHVPEICQVYT